MNIRVGPTCMRVVKSLTKTEREKQMIKLYTSIHETVACFWRKISKRVCSFFCCQCSWHLPSFFRPECLDLIKKWITFSQIKTLFGFTSRNSSVFYLSKKTHTHTNASAHSYAYSVFSPKALVFFLGLWRNRSKHPSDWLSDRSLRKIKQIARYALYSGVDLLDKKRFVWNWSSHVRFIRIDVIKMNKKQLESH